MEEKSSILDVSISSGPRDSRRNLKGRTKNTNPKKDPYQWRPNQQRNAKFIYPTKSWKILDYAPKVEHLS